jgi:hypothetical protein
MPSRKVMPALTGAVALGVGALTAMFLMSQGQQIRADYDKRALVRTSSEHGSTCGRLGMPVDNGQHDGCLRELDRLKGLHDKWQSESVENMM